MEHDLQNDSSPRVAPGQGEDKPDEGGYHPTVESKADYSIRGFRIRSFHPADPWDVVVHAAREQAEWVPANWDAPAADRPTPTTILYGGKVYQVSQARERDDGWVYYLSIWPPGEISRRVVRLTAQAVALDREERREIARLAVLSAISPFYETFLGWLPAFLQEKLSLHWHFSPEYASRKNAVFEFFLGLYFYILLMSYHDYHLYYVSFYCFFEGCLRLAHTANSNSPFGLAPLEIVERAGRRFWRFVQTLNA